MKNYQSWQPHLRTRPLWNSLVLPTEWISELGASELIKIENEEEAEDSVPADPARTHLVDPHA
jgi:hypothetical protein